MSFLKKLRLHFRGGDEEHLKVLEQAIGLLRLSAFYSLQKRYNAKYGVEKAGTLAVAVVSRMILEPPGDERLVLFAKRNAGVISDELSRLRGCEEISGPSGCGSYLFAAETLHAVMATIKEWKSAKELQEQAQRLGIHVPTSTEICGSTDKKQCIESMHSFARAFYYTNTWTGASPAVTDVSFPSIPFDYDFLAKTLLDSESAEADLEVPSPTCHAGAGR